LERSAKLAIDFDMSEPLPLDLPGIAWWEATSG
jgi:hypothetical protein